ncbi:MAG: asparagine synthase (glutamine-hydrolyzing) [Kiloniellaceae bacterium]
MCGVVALYAPDRPVPGEALQRAVARLRHRGPDGEAVWTAPHGRVALGHTRLSIIDLETGAQPIASENDDLHIAVNGEFYDFERQRTALERAGHRFRTRSDSEIALHLYQDLGTGCAAELRGEFAFVLWDETAQRLVACRDRYGVKPLFYAEHDGVLYVASEIKALFAAGVPARWDAEAIYFGIALRGIGRTAFAGVRAVPPGHFLIADAGGLRLEPYWDLDYPAEGAATPLRPEDAVRQFRALLEEAVRLRLRADVPVACYLSGGLDSCAILGLAARHRADRIRAFTLRFDHPEYDEGPVAAEMAALAGADYNPLVVRQDDLADNFSDAVFHAEGTCINTHGVAKYLLSLSVRSAGYKVVLTGEGADEVLAGYPHFRQDLLAAAVPGEAVQLEGALAKANALSRGILLAERGEADSPLLRACLGTVPSFLHSQLNRFEHMGRLQNPAYFAPFQGRDPAELLLAGLDVERRLKGRAPVDQALYLWAKTMLPNYILATLGDRMEMAHAVEGRLPFLDPAVAEFLQGVPVDLKIRGMTEKYLLREAVRDVVSERVYRRQKHPFLSPAATPKRSPKMAALLQDTLRSKTVEALPFFDARRMRALADAVAAMTPRQRASHDSHLMVVLSTILLHQRMGVAG